jgi:hypothetical protein
MADGEESGMIDVFVDGASASCSAEESRNQLAYMAKKQR